MLLKKFVLALSLLTATSLSAYAADLAPRPVEPAAPIEAAPFTWTGFYVGAQAGYEWGQVSGPFQNSARTGSGPYSFNTNGGLIGGYAGYNYQYDSVVVGIEGDGNFAFGNKSNQTVSYPDDGLWTIGAQEDWTADARLRVGYAFGRFLPYITGGAAFGNVKMSYALLGEAPYLTETSSRVGWTIGAGLEYAVTDNIIARIEYRYTDLGSKSFNNVAEDTYDRVKFRSSSVLVGVSYKF